MSGLFAGLFERQVTSSKAGPEKRSNWWDSLTVSESSSGVSVTPENAMTSSAVFACVRILAETIATLPLILYERDGRARKRATDFYLYSILHDDPNEFMTSFELRETLQGHMGTWGNGYSQLDYDAAGRITSIFPLRPDKILQIVVNEGRKLYQYELPSGELKWLPGEKIWHLKAFGDGMYGYSPVGLMRNAIGMGLAVEKFGAKFFANGARPGGVLEHPGKLGDEAFKRLRESWADAHQGLDNSHKAAILEEGLKWHDIGVPPEEAQFLETRKFQVTEIARIYRIPPHMIADLERSTNNNIEHQGLEFVSLSMMPWFTRWEQSIRKNLMLKSERKRYYAEFLVDGLLRGDTSSRTNYYSTGRQWGWLSVNDVREKENMNPVEGGDEYLQPLNMVPAGSDLPISPSPKDGRGQTPSIEGQGRALPLPSPFLNGQENRARSAAGARHKLAGRQARVFADAAARIVRRERNDVRAQARKLINGGSTSEFERWLAGFYENHATWSAEQMLPVMLAYAELVADVVSEETGQEDLAEQVENFVRAYAQDFGKRESLRNLASLLELVRRMANAAADEIQAAVEGRLDEWMESKPEAMAHEEAVRENNAVAVALYVAIGKERIMSVATGASSCPYCTDLDGRVIGINEFILQAGDFQPDGAEKPLTVSSNKRHAPYHGGCDCMTVSA